MTAFTDPSRRYRRDPGHPEICNIYRLHQFFTRDKVTEIASECRSAGMGCVDCKRLLAQGINTTLKPFRERRRELEASPGYLEEVLQEGAHRARAIATVTLSEAKSRMGLT